MENDTQSLEELTIGFIGIGGAGSIGTETVKELYRQGMRNIKKIYVKNRDTSESIKTVKDEFITKVLGVTDDEMQYADARTMAKECDIIVTAFEASCGQKTGKNITLDDNFRQKLFNGNIGAFYDQKDKDGNVQEGLIKSLAGYKGLIIDATNPLEGMCYWMLKLIPGLSEDQVIGFMPDTPRFNRLCIEYFKNNCSADYQKLNENEIRVLRAKVRCNARKCYYSIRDYLLKKDFLQSLCFSKKEIKQLKSVCAHEFDKVYNKKIEKLNEQEIRTISDSIEAEFNHICKKKGVNAKNLKNRLYKKFSKLYEESYDEVKEDTLAGIERGIILGEHSPNFVSVKSTINPPGDVDWDKIAEDFHEKIDEEARNWGLDLIRWYGTTGDECAPHLTRLINRVIDEANDELKGNRYFRFCAQTHYIELPNEVLEEVRKLPEKYQIKGICTGIPVFFRLTKEKQLRATIDPRFDPRYFYKENPRDAAKEELYEKPYCKFAFRKNISRSVLQTQPKAKILSEEEEEKFIDCIRTTIFGENGKGGLLETVVLKEVEEAKRPRYLTTNKIIAMRENRSPNLNFFEVIETEDSLKLVLPFETDMEARGRQPPFEALATAGNKIIAISSGYQTRMHIWNVPQLNIMDIIKNGLKSDLELLIDVELEDCKQIKSVAIDEDSVYIACTQKTADDKLISEIKKKDFTGKTVAKSEMPGEAKLHCFGDTVYCGVQGKIHAFSKQLVKIMEFDTGNNQNIEKMKAVNLNNIEYLFGSDYGGKVYMWRTGETTPSMRLNSDTKHFDTQIEKAGSEDIIQLYAICQRKLYAIQVDLTAQGKHHQKEIGTVEELSDLIDLQASDQDLFAMIGNKVHRFKNKKKITPPFEVKNETAQSCITRKTC